MQDRVFWKRAPKEPRYDPMMYALLLPACASVFGYFLVGIFAFSFGAIYVIPEEVRQWLTILGSAFVVLAAESNSPATFAVVFRKLAKDRGNVNVWDWTALCASATGTLFSLLVVFALNILSSASFSGDAQWLTIILNWGPLVAAVAVIFDF